MLILERGLQNYETIKFRCLKPLSFWCSLMAEPGNWWNRLKADPLTSSSYTKSAPLPFLPTQRQSPDSPSLSHQLTFYVQPIMTSSVSFTFKIQIPASCSSPPPGLVLPSKPPASPGCLTGSFLTSCPLWLLSLQLVSTQWSQRPHQEVKSDQTIFLHICSRGLQCPWTMISTLLPVGQLGFWPSIWSASYVSTMLLGRYSPCL